MKAFKRILCVALCLTITILGLSFMAPKADALALTVGLGIVVAALAVGGLTYLVTSGGTSALTEAVSNNVEDWLEDSGNVVDFPTPNDFFEFLGDPDNQDGPSMNDGRVLVGAASAHLLINFLVWLKDHLGLDPVEDGGEPVQILSSYALPLQNGYLHLTELDPLDSRNLLRSGDWFNIADLPSSGETILFTFYNGNYVTYSRSSNKFYVYGYAGQQQLTALRNQSTGVLVRFSFGFYNSDRFAVFTESTGHNYGLAGNSYLGTSDTTLLLYGLVAVNDDVSAELTQTGVLLGDDYVPGQGLQLDLELADPPEDLDEWGEAVLQETVAGTLDIEGAYEQGPEQLQYPDSILGWLQWIWEALSNTRLSNIIQEIRNIPGRFADWFQQIITWLGNLPGTLTNLFNDLKTAIQALPQQIANAISSAFALDPELALEIGDAWNGKFGWIDDIKDWFDGVTALEPEPPVIYIHLEDSNSHYGYNYGGREVALDLSWYAAYKQDVDALISGFLWLGFLWLVFKRTADIINGVGMADREAHDIIEVSDGEGHTSLFRRRRK